MRSAYFLGFTIAIGIFISLNIATQIKKNIFARKIVNKNAFYSVPISSIKFDIYLSNGALSDLKSLCIDDVKSKAFAMPLDHNLIFAPLRHSI